MLYYDYALFWTIMLAEQCLEQFVLHKTHRHTTLQYIQRKSSYTANCVSSLFSNLRLKAIKVLLTLMF